MKVSSNQILKVGVSVATSLCVGMLSVISSNTPTQAADVNVQSQQGSSQGCVYKPNRNSQSVQADNSTCYEVKTVVKCSNGKWYDPDISRTVARSYCPGISAIIGAAWARTTPGGPWIGPHFF